jgi:ethanolamine-phosphate phospho-lyase
LDNETVDFSVDESNLLEILSNKLPSYFQKPVKSINRDYLVIDNESNKIYRLLSYVEGDLLVNAPHTKELFESFGKLLAKMDNELMGKRYLSIMSRKYDWDILQFDLNVKTFSTLKILRCEGL